VFQYLINFISRSLEFSKSESKGTLGLILIITGSILLYQVYVFHLKKDKSELNPTQEASLNAWVQEVKASIETRNSEERVAFSKRSDLGLKKDILPSTSSSSRPRSSFDGNPKEKVHTSKDIAIVLQDLNKATAEQLQQVRGIGPAFSARIIKYRQLLGGFVSPNQLSEVYGLDEEVIGEIFKYYIVNPSPTPIDLNSDSAKVLARHPYISYDLAWTIINYRKQNGDLQSAEDVKKIKSIDPATFQKLKPYLD